MTMLEKEGVKSLIMWTLLTSSSVFAPLYVIVILLITSFESLKYSLLLSFMVSKKGGIFHSAVASAFENPKGFIGRMTEKPKSCWYMYDCASNCFHVCNAFGLASNARKLSACFPFAALLFESIRRVRPLMYACAS